MQSPRLILTDTRSASSATSQGVTVAQSRQSTLPQPITPSADSRTTRLPHATASIREVSSHLASLDFAFLGAVLSIRLCRIGKALSLQTSRDVVLRFGATVGEGTLMAANCGPPSRLGLLFAPGGSLRAAARRGECGETAFTGLGHLRDGNVLRLVTGVSADGSHVVGSSARGAATARGAGQVGPFRRVDQEPRRRPGGSRLRRVEPTVRV